MRDNRLNRTSPAVLLAALVATGCGGISVSTDWDPSANFAAMQTFTWLPDATTDGSGQAGSQLIDQRIRAAIEADLMAAGMTRDDANPDIAVGYQLSTQDQVSYTTMSSGWGGSGYRWGGGWGMGTGFSTTTQNVTTVGTLLIGIFDVESQNLIWQGAGEKTLSGSAQTPEQSTQKVNEAITKIMADFPPGSDG